jgi:DNA-binding transcriptional MocR family regulator
MKQLADQAGFKIVGVNFDADGFTITASEQYLKNIPLMAPESIFVNPKQTIFSDEELESFRKHGEELNKTGEADCAGFYLYKK